MAEPARGVERDLPIECAGVKIFSGDIVFGDADDAVVIPQERAAEVIARAQELEAGEDHTRHVLSRARLLADVFAQFGIP